MPSDSVAPPALPAPPVAVPITSRIGALDTFRFLTVTLALLSHGVLEFRVETVTSPEVWLVLRSITRSATPGLLLLFGVMAEIVYARRYAERGAALFPRLLRRAGQCYGAFVALAVLVALCQAKPEGYVWRSLGFLTLEGYNVIFALYAFLMFALMILLPVRTRFGAGGLIAALGLLWAADFALVSRLPAASPTFSVLADITLGTGGTWGPSAFHSISLVIAGMVFGRALYGTERKQSATIVAIALLLLSCVIVMMEMTSKGAVGFFRSVVDLSHYRAQNHPAYYAYGVLGAAALLPIAYLVNACTPSRLRDLMHRLGGRTFSYFFIGNAVLIAFSGYKIHSAAHAVLAVLSYLIAAMAVSLLWQDLSRRRKA